MTNTLKHFKFSKYILFKGPQNFHKALTTAKNSFRLKCPADTETRTEAENKESFLEIISTQRTKLSINTIIPVIEGAELKGRTTSKITKGLYFSKIPRLTDGNGFRHKWSFCMKT